MSISRHPEAYPEITKKGDVFFASVKLPWKIKPISVHQDGKPIPFSNEDDAKKAANNFLIWELLPKIRSEEITEPKFDNASLPDSVLSEIERVFGGSSNA